MMRGIRDIVLIGALLVALTPTASAAAGAATEDLWTSQCQGEGDKAGCSAVLDVMVATSDKPNAQVGRMLRMSVVKVDQQQTLMLALLPLGIFLPSGVVIQIDDTPQQAMTVRRCTAEGCDAAVLMTPETLIALRKGSSLKVAFKADPTGPNVVVTMSLKTIGPALDKMK
jgi:invasion protein IalB